MLEVAFWTHRTLWQLLLAGKFDTFPDLKYAPVECGSWWVGDLLFKTDVMFGGTNWKVKKMSSRTRRARSSGCRRSTSGPTCSSAPRR